MGWVRSEGGKGEWMIENVSKLEAGAGRPLVSVIIPCYQNRCYLQQTLASVLPQVTGDMEVFVLDDASPEGCPLEGSEFTGQVPVFRQPVNLGHVGNLVDGIRRARGQWVHILHGDDFVLPGFYAAILDAIGKFPNAGAVFTQNVVVNPAGQWIGLSQLLGSETAVLPDLLQRLAVENVIQTPSIVVRRAVYEELGAFDSEFTWCEDWEMWSRLASRFAVVYVGQALAAYRQHGSSSTSRHLREGLTGQDTMRCLRAVWSRLPPAGKQRAMRNGRMLHAVRCRMNAAYSERMSGVFRQLLASLRFRCTPLNAFACVVCLLRQVRRRLGK